MSAPIIPLLTTTINTPLSELTSHLIAQCQNINQWIDSQMAALPTPIYTSMDLRHAGFKIAPVDTNLFPGGFNHLHEKVIPDGVKAFQATIQQITAGNHILLVPENMTRNPGYFENIASLQALLETSGYQVRIGSLLSDLHQTRKLSLPSGKTITLEPLLIENHSVHLDNYKPDLILLNNDLSDSESDYFTNIKQPVLPNIHMGWSTRTKTKHFDHYAKISQDFAEAFNFDPWLITPLHDHCASVNFNTPEGIADLKSKVTHLLEAIASRYKHYGIAQRPFVAIKADAGTYGMGIMMIHDPEELDELNKKQKKNMQKSKTGTSVSSVIIQEGIPTTEMWDTSVAEPVIYAIGKQVIGGFYRLHQSKNAQENLNAPGMSFQPVPCHFSCNTITEKSDDPQNRFYLYGIISRLAILAAAKEEQTIKQNPTYNIKDK